MRRLGRHFSKSSKRRLWGLLPRRVAASIPAITRGDLPTARRAYARIQAHWCGLEWYIFEFDGKDLCRGLAVPQEPETTEFSLRSLSSVRGPQGQHLTYDEDYVSEPLEVIADRARHEMERLDGLSDEPTWP